MFTKINLGDSPILQKQGGWVMDHPTLLEKFYFFYPLSDEFPEKNFSKKNAPYNAHSIENEPPLIKHECPLIFANSVIADCCGIMSWCVKH